METGPKAGAMAANAAGADLTAASVEETSAVYAAEARGRASEFAGTEREAACWLNGDASGGGDE